MRGIQKVDTNVMMNAEAMKVIEDNHIKKSGKEGKTSPSEENG